MSSSAENFLQEFTGIIVFNISNQEFCINEKNLVTILNPQDYRPQINTPNFNNEISIGDMIVPLFDIHSYFKIPKPSHTDDTRILVAIIDEIKIAFFVEKVKEVITVDAKIIGETLKFVPLKEVHLKGKILYESREIYLPDLKEIAETSISGNKVTIKSI